MNKKKFDEVHLQWFSDPEPEINIEESVDDQEVEYVTLQPGEEPPTDEPVVDEEKAALERRIAELEGRTDPINAIQQGFNTLGERLETPTPANAPVQGPSETDEEFSKRLNDELFGQNTYGALKEAVTRIVAPMVGNLSSQTMEQAKTLMKMDAEKGPIFKQYEKQINDVIRSLPANVQSNPQVLEHAYNQVVSANINEIIDTKVQSQLEAQKSTKTRQVPDPIGPSPGGVQRPAKKKVYVTAQEERNLQRESDTSGVPVDKLREMMIEKKQRGDF